MNASDCDCVISKEDIMKRLSERLSETNKIFTNNTFGIDLQLLVKTIGDYNPHFTVLDDSERDKILDGLDEIHERLIDSEHGLLFVGDYTMSTIYTLCELYGVQPFIMSQREMECEGYSSFDGTLLDGIADFSIDVVFCNCLKNSTDPDKLVNELGRIIHPEGIIVIQEHDCRSWRDVYELDMNYYIQKQLTLDTPLVYGYRPRTAWRSLFENMNMTCIHESDIGHAYTFFDVYQF
jgi:SAM-dependent methyltransferase